MVKSESSVVSESAWCNVNQPTNHSEAYNCVEMPNASAMRQEVDEYGKEGIKQRDAEGLKAKDQQQKVRSKVESKKAVCGLLLWGPAVLKTTRD